MQKALSKVEIYTIHPTNFTRSSNNDLRVHMMLVHFIFMIDLLFTIVRANFRNDLIIDYFKSYKKVPSVVGFSCNSYEDFLLTKRLHDIGLTGSINTIRNGYEVRKIALTSYNKLGVFLDFRCYNTEVVNFIFSNGSRFYGELHFWFIISSKSLEDVTNSVDDEGFNISTDFVVAVPSANNSYDLYDVYNPWKRRGANITITFLGAWIGINEFKIAVNESRLHRRSNMNGLPLKASFFWSETRPISMPLEDYYQIYTLDPIDGMEKYGFNILRHLTELYNFTFRVSMAPLWADGDGIGPIQRLIFKDEADVSGSGTSITEARYDFVRYAHTSWPFKSSFMFRTSKKKEIRFKEILGPFDDAVWYSMIILVALGTVLMTFIFRYEDDDTLAVRLSNSILLIIGSMCQQGTNMVMVQMSTRAAYFWIMMSSLLLYNYYGAAVVSVRLNEPIVKINDSLVQLSKLNLKLASQWMAYFGFIVTQPDYEVQVFYNESWKKVPKSEQFMEPEKGMKMVKKGEFAYHTFTEVGYPLAARLFSEREICELTEVHMWRTELCSFAISLNSTFTELARVGLTKIAESGLQNRQLKRWTAAKPECDQNTLDASGITIYEFAPHLIILAIGMGLSIIIWIFEKANGSFIEEDHDIPRLQAWT